MRGFQGNCRHLLLHTTSSARANHHPRDETTEPKNANAETGQHLFFFPSSDTTAALHFFFVKRRVAPFFECKICKMLGKHLPCSPFMHARKIEKPAAAAWQQHRHMIWFDGLPGGRRRGRDGRCNGAAAAVDDAQKPRCVRHGQKKKEEGWRDQVAGNDDGGASPV